MIKAR